MTERHNIVNFASIDIINFDVLIDRFAQKPVQQPHGDYMVTPKNPGLYV